MTTKTCTGCHETLPVDAFSRDARQKDGLFYRCKACEKRRLLEYRHRKYGTVDRLEAQEGRCAICQEPLGLADAQHDHDHRCCPARTWSASNCPRCFRGLLCKPCNLGLGQFRDDPGRLRAAAAYLEAHTPQGASAGSV